MINAKELDRQIDTFDIKRYEYIFKRICRINANISNPNITYDEFNKIKSRVKMTRIYINRIVGGTTPMLAMYLNENSTNSQDRIYTYSPVNYMGKILLDELNMLDSMLDDIKINKEFDLF